MSNLPPGVNVNDIPGNRPEDERLDRLYEQVWEKFRREHEKDAEVFDKYMQHDDPFEDALWSFFDVVADISYEHGYNQGVAEAYLEQAEIREED